MEIDQCCQHRGETKLIINYQNETLYLKPNRDFSDEFHYNMAGMELSLPFPGLPVFEVDYIRKDSPADRVGIKEGDFIQSINGSKPGDVTLNEIFEMFRKDEGRKINLTYTREGLESPRYVSFVLKRVI